MKRWLRIWSVCCVSKRTKVSIHKIYVNINLGKVLCPAWKYRVGSNTEKGVLSRKLAPETSHIGSKVGLIERFCIKKRRQKSVEDSQYQACSYIYIHIHESASTHMYTMHMWTYVNTYVQPQFTHFHKKKEKCIGKY